MSEHVLPVQEPTTETPAVERVGHFRRIVAGGTAILALSGLGIAACSSDKSSLANSPNSAATPSTLTADQKQEAAQFCPEGIDMNGNAADSLHNVGAREAFIPAVGTVDSKGKVTLDDPKVVRTELEKQLCNDRRFLGVFMAFISEPREDFHLPDETTTARAVKLGDLYAQNEPAALDAIKRSSRWLDNLVPTTRFAVIKNQAVNVEPDRVSDSDTHIKGVKTVKSLVTGNLTVWQFGYNHDDPSLSEHQKSVLDQLQNIQGIQHNGILTMGIWIGESNAQFTEQQTPPTTIPASTEHNNQNNNNNNNANSSRNNNSQNNNINSLSQGGGHFGTSNGNGESNQPGSVQESGGNGGHTPGTQPSFGGGGGGNGGGNHGGGGGTPGTTPETTPRTTPNTTPNTTPQTTPTPTTKPGDPGQPGA